MYCSKCGHHLEEDALFCPECGAPVARDRNLSEDTLPIIEFSDDDLAENMIEPPAHADETSDDSDFSEGSIYRSDMADTAPLETEAVNDAYQGPVVKKIERRHRRSSQKYEKNEEETAEPDDSIEPLADAPEQQENTRFSERPRMRLEERLAQQNQKQNEDKHHHKIIVICTVLIITAVVAVAALIGFSLFRNYRLGQLSETLDEYEQILEQYPTDNADYLSLLEQAQAAVEKGDFMAVSSLRSQMRDAISQIESSSEVQTMLVGLKNEYTDIFSRYRITEDYQETYDTVMADLDTAISSLDSRAYSELENRLESLRINLNTANQQAVTALKNEITRIDVSSASSEDAQTLKDFENRVDEALAVDNYASALDILEEWKASAEQIAEKISSQNESIRESLEKESLKMESEDAAAQTETGQTETDDYILPQSSTEVLTEEDIEGLSAEELLLARNEIYARHGRKFSTPEIQAYFDSKSWYNGTISPEDFDTSVLNSTERANVSFIKSHE